MMPAAAQSAPPITYNDLPPSSVLAEELTNFDRIRSDMANWSDVELAAFQATTERSKAACSRIEQTPHEGEEALALARLCAVGLDWDGTYSAARWYTRRTAPPAEAQHLSTGFALLLKADLSLQNIRRALEELKEVQERVPFTDDTDSIFTYTIYALEVMRPGDAVAASMVRQPLLLDAVAGKNNSVSTGRAEAEAWHVLALLHVAGKVDMEGQQKALLLQAIAQRSAPLSIPDQYMAERGRRQYEWLGQKAPSFGVVHSSYPLAAHRATASRPDTATLVVIETVGAADATTLSQAVDSLRTHLAPRTQAKLLLMGDPPKATKHEANAAVVHAEYTQEKLLDTFALQAGPVFLLLDEQQRIAWLGTGSAAWLNPQQQAEALLNRASSH
ncbi:MAG: hypothetical protein V4734_09865 [Terriglobus sp.]